MSQNYLPFFRKYRPQTLADIVGQAHIVRMLKSAIELNKVAHAYLFCGPRGTGKTSCARIFAKSLNCVKGPTITPCMACDSCIDITNARGLDVIEIDAATNRGIEDAKNLIEQTKYAPMNGKYKIFIIDEVHMLTLQAFNALLKTLEEPPENVIFILATTEPQSVLETIASRCQRFDFRRITIDDIVSRLREISNLENIKIDDDALFEIAKNVSGGLRDSLALLDQVSILGTSDKITKQTIDDVLGKLTFSELMASLKAIYANDFDKSYEILNNIYASGNEPRTFAENFLEFLRNCYAILCSDDEKILSCINLNKAEFEEIKKAGFEPCKIAFLIEKTFSYYKEIKNAINPYLISEIMLVGLCNADICKKQAQTSQQAKSENIVVSKIEKKVEKTNVEANVETKAVEIAPTQPKEDKKEVKEVPEPIKEVAQENIKDIAPEQTPSLVGNEAEVWTQILNAITSIPAKCFFKDAKVARLVEITTNSITIGIFNDNMLETAKTSMRLNPLQKAIESVFETKHEVRLIKITPDTKTIKTNYVEKKPQVQKPPTEEYAPDEPNLHEVDISKNLEQIEEVKSEPPVQSEAEMQIYSNKTREMLESFNGKIIE